MPELLLGQLAVSRAGRDKGRFMIVTKVIDSDYVYVVDGSLRKVDNPKKKKIKHLKLLNKRAESIAEKIENKRKFSNDEVRKALKELVYSASVDDTESQI
jgi:large subunit ribosomal protein L14e